MRATHLSHPILSSVILITLGEQYKLQASPVMWLSLISCHFILGPNILLRHKNILIRSRWSPLMMDFVYFNLYIPRQQMGRQKTLDRMVASIPW